VAVKRSRPSVLEAQVSRSSGSPVLRPDARAALGAIPPHLGGEESVAPETARLLATIGTMQDARRESWMPGAWKGRRGATFCSHSRSSEPLGSPGGAVGKAREAHLYSGTWIDFRRCAGRARAGDLGPATCSRGPAVDPLGRDVWEDPRPRSAGALASTSLSSPPHAACAASGGTRRIFPF